MKLKISNIKIQDPIIRSDFLCQKVVKYPDMIQKKKKKYWTEIRIQAPRKKHQTI